VNVGVMKTCSMTVAVYMRLPGEDAHGRPVRQAILRTAGACPAGRVVASRP
jgi:hypothetical protein